MNTDFFYKVSWTLNASGYFVTKYHIDEYRYVTINTDNGTSHIVGLWCKTPDGDISITFRHDLTREQVIIFTEDCKQERI